MSKQFQDGAAIVEDLLSSDFSTASEALDLLLAGAKPSLLVNAFGSPLWKIRCRAHEELSRMRCDEALPALREALLSSDVDRAYWAIRTLSFFGLSAAGHLLEAIDRVPPGLRLFIIRALRNCGGRSLDALVPVLIRLLDDEDWPLREEAAGLLVEMPEKSLPAVRSILSDGSQNQRFWAFRIMARIMGEKAVSPLSKILEAPPEQVAHDSRPYALAALKEIKSPAAIPHLLNLLSNESWYLRAEAAEVLAGMGDVAVKDLLSGLAQENSDVRYWILTTLRKILGEKAIEIITRYVRSDHKGTRYSAVLTLGDIPSTSAAEILIESFSDEAWVIRKAAADALSKMGDTAVEPLLRSLQSPNKECLFWALRTLGRVGGQRVVAFVARMLDHDDRSIRLAAVDALSRINDAAGLKALVNAFRSDDWVVRQAASDALLKLGVPALVYLLAFIEDEHEDVAYWTRQTLKAFLLPGLDNLVRQVAELSRGEMPMVQEELNRIDPQVLLRDLHRSEIRLEDLLGNRGRRLVGAHHEPATGHEPERSSSRNMDLATIFDRHLGDPYVMSMDELLAEAEHAQASDLHLKVGCPPILRVNGELRKSRFEVLTAANTLNLCGSILSPLQKEELTQNLQMDLSYRVSTGSRFRINMFLQTRGLEAACRYIDPKIPTFSDLNLPERQMRRISSLQDGLILVTGPTGCGKTTTMAAMVDYINSNFARHIITIEDPIEYVHTNQLSFISYREVGLDVRSFAMGLRGALREDPDVILIGELRDRETVATALTLAGTGHLVLASFHTSNASQTVEQLTDFFPAGQQDHARRQLAFILKAVVSQRLFRRQDKRGRIPAYEILITTTAVRNIIREGATQQLHSVMQAGAEAGMLTFDMVLKDLVAGRMVSYDDALPFVYDPHEFKQSSRRRS